MRIGEVGQSGHNARATANIQLLVLANGSVLVLKLEGKQEITTVIIMAVVILLKLKIVVLMSAYVQVRNLRKNGKCRKNAGKTQNLYRLKFYLEWSTWGKWSSCTKTCDSGTRYKVRYCVLGGPDDCEGPANIEEPCNTQPCDIEKKECKDNYAFCPDWQ